MAALVESQRKLEQLTKAAARRQGRAVAAKRRKACRWGLRVVRKLWRQCGFALLVLSYLCAGNSNIIMAMGKASSAVADVSNAAGNLVSATANATVALSDVAVDILLVASSALDEAVHGVDVLNTTVSRSTHRSVGPLPPLVAWLQGGANGTMPPSAGWSMAAIVQAQCAQTLALESQREFFDVVGTYWHFRLKCRQRADGSVAFAALRTNASFEAFWSNPLWEQLGFRVDSESRKIIASLREALHELEPISTEAMAIDDLSLYQVLGIGPPRDWCAWARRCGLCAASLSLVWAVVQARRTGWRSLWPTRALARGRGWVLRRAQEVSEALREASLEEAEAGLFDFDGSELRGGFVDLGCTDPQ